MKTILTYSLLIAGALMLFSMTGPVESHGVLKKRFSKTIERTYPIDKNGEVAIINKYGNIDMQTWPKSEVKLEVVVVVNATSESVAEDVFETIGIEFEDSRSRVSAETVIETKKNYWWNWGKNLKSDFEINYTVYMPISCSVDFNNKYGNINMMDLENDAAIQVKYGNLTMGDLEGDLNLSLGYGNGYAGAVKDINAEIMYSKFRCDYAQDFIGETKYSGMTVNSINRMVVQTKYDNYTLGEVSEFINDGKYDNFVIDRADRITIETKYTDVKVGKLNVSLSAEMDYGGIKVNELARDFSEVRVESSYAGVNIAPESGASYKLQLESKYLDIDIPNTPDFEEQKDGSERYIRASYNGGGEGQIQLIMDYGFLKIK